MSVGFYFSYDLHGLVPGIIGAFIGLFLWFVTAVVSTGAFLILGEIRKSLKKIEKEVDIQVAARNFVKQNLSVPKTIHDKFNKTS